MRHFKRTRKKANSNASPNTPRLDPTRCQLMENTPDLNRGIFDPDQVGGITTKVLGSELSTRILGLRSRLHLGFCLRAPLLLDLSLRSPFLSGFGESR